jgi:ankyrin repeat protein
LVIALVEEYSMMVNITTDHNNNTPLHVAASMGRLSVCGTISCQPRRRHKSNRQHYSAAGCRGDFNREVIKYLVEKGADWTKLIADGLSLLDLAVTAGNLSVVKYWTDRLCNDSSPEILVLTKSALELALILKKKGRADQDLIIEELNYALQEIATK